ncbi:TraV family lipoprotein [Sphingobium arseniciresistens]|uniref:TraV family lipoprotein n=1 Tax=Sphingobium arseniciresistens TaxID=3030834 RepID=UPI0023B8D6CD|nr:TraV family lipoprotein [Sphingobium arseniciresistens]
MSAPARRGVSRRLPAFASLTLLVALGGCASFGGNVKGSFSCAAPDGICAPTSTIDDRALAMISGDANGASTTPAGPYMDDAPKARAYRTAASGQRTPVQQVDAGRTRERVLRIVFQPYIDERGRLHEASAVHAVVARGEWQQQALATATPIPDQNAVATLERPKTLAEAVDRADPPDAVVASIDPNLPDPAVVAAARARKADPVEAIKADVASRLAPRAGRTPAVTTGTPAASSSASAATGVSKPVAPSVPSAASKAATPPGTPVPTQAAATARPAAEQAALATPLPKTTSSAEAQARVKGDPRYQSATRNVEQTAQQAATDAVLPEAKPTPKATVRAAGFPAAVPEDN